MAFQMTDHAQTRFRQRGINEQVLDYLIKYGDTKHAPGGALRITLTKRNASKLISALKKEIHKIERAQG
jgi:hypothetical protein